MGLEPCSADLSQRWTYVNGQIRLFSSVLCWAVRDHDGDGLLQDRDVVYLALCGAPRAYEQYFRLTGAQAAADTEAGGMVQFATACVFAEPIITQSNGI